MFKVIHNIHTQTLSHVSRNHIFLLYKPISTITKLHRNLMTKIELTKMNFSCKLKTFSNKILYYLQSFSIKVHDLQDSSFKLYTISCNQKKKKHNHSNKPTNTWVVVLNSKMLTNCQKIYINSQ